MNKWISIFDKMPEEGREVLLTLADGAKVADGELFGNQIFIGYFENENPFPYFCLVGYDGLYREEVLAWMPLPEPYKEENNDNSRETE